MMKALSGRLRAVMNRVPARSRIAIGLVMLLGGVLMAAIALRMVPNERQAIMLGRAKFCEAIAVHCSIAVSSHEASTLQQTLQAIIQRDTDVQSATVRKQDGTVVAQIGSAQTEENAAQNRNAMDSAIFVPIYSNETKWGAVEVRFSPLGHSGFLGYLQSPQVLLVLFVTCVCLLLFQFYLRKMLQHLDPSKVVPPRVRSALDTLAEGLLVLDKSERIVLANHAFGSIVGRTPEELLGKRADSLNWEADGFSPQAGHAPWTQVLADGTPLHGIRMHMKDLHGGVRTLSVNCSPVLGTAGKNRGVLISFEDVTVLENQEIELRKSKDAAESANRAKSDFLARMSHEIRTPMNAILGFTDVLRRGYEENETERQDYLNTIHASGQHLLELINDILDLSKIEAGKLEIELSRCSPHQLITEVVSVLIVRAREKGIGLEFEWNGRIPETIQTDPTRVRQALTNLIGNAIKFTDTGRVRVVARLAESSSAAPYLDIDVIDSGIGMKPEALGRIFTPFAQADSSITRRFGGTGLGLSISKQIAEALNGSLTVKSEYGKGTDFRLRIATGSLADVTLLDKPPRRSTAGRGASGQAAIRLPGTRILLVEDGESNRKLFSLVLQRAGATIDQAADGKTGSDLALAGNYQVILMDMQMPIMDGYTAAAYLRQHSLQTPIIALTAHAMRGDEEKCRAAGCSGFLTKPIDVDLLLRTVSDAAYPQGAPAEVAAPVGASNAPMATSLPAGAIAIPDHKDDKMAAAVPITSTSAMLSLHSTLPTEDPEFCAIVEEFIDRLHNQIGAIQNAWHAQEFSELASLAHWVKGSGGTAGFHDLTDPARELERAVRDNQTSEIAGKIAELQAIADRIVRPSVQHAASPEPASR